MGEFVKPKTVFITDTEYIKSLVNANLKKDLHDNEEICQHCHGTGMVVVNNRYGLSDDPDKIKGHFPYNHQSISFCPNCYNGIVYRCPLCGNLIKRGRLVCDCEAQKEIERQKIAKKMQEEFEKAPVAPKEIVDSMECFYSDCYDYNDGYFFDFGEFFECWANNHVKNEDRPFYCWVTDSIEMSIDAYDVIMSATEDLYEDAYSNISSKAKEELQKYIDDWCKRCGVGTTYYESHKYKVRIPWEEYDGQ